MQNILNCSEYYNPFFKPYMCMTFLDSIVIFISTTTFLLVVYFLITRE